MQEVLQQQAAEQSGTEINAETRVWNTSASIAAYLAVQGEKDDEGTESDAGNGDADSGQPGDIADTEPAEVDHDAQSEDVAPDQGSQPAQTVEKN